MSTGANTGGAGILDTGRALVQAVAENPEALTRVQILSLMCVFIFVIMVIVVFIAWWKGRKENSVGIDDIILFLFVKAPRGAIVLLSTILFVILGLVLYLLSLGLVNVSIDTELLGKGKITAWPKPLGKAIKFIIENIIVKTIVIVIGIIGITAQETYKRVLIPMGYIIKSLSKYCAKLAKKKFNDWVIEPHVAIAKTRMETGGWE